MLMISCFILLINLIYNSNDNGVFSQVHLTICVFRNMNIYSELGFFLESINVLPLMLCL